MGATSSHVSTLHRVIVLTVTTQNDIVTAVSVNRIVDTIHSDQIEL